MPRIGKFFLIFLIGLAVMLIFAGVTGDWWTHILSTGLFITACAIVAASVGEDGRYTAGWVMFWIGVVFTAVFILIYYLGGPTCAGCKLATWLCGFESIIFGLLVGAIAVKEKSDRGKY